MAEEGRQIEQYIYSRADRGFDNHGVEVKIGFGFVAESKGMDKKLKSAVRSYCNQFPSGGAVKGNLKSFPVFQKVYLPQVKRLLLQHNNFLDSIKLSGKRAFHVAHGYLVPREILDAVNPFKCFMLPYTKDDPNIEGGIKLESIEALNPDMKRIQKISPLSETMKVLGLGKKVFKQLLFACFDALANGTQILIAYDFSSEAWEASLYGVLYWIFACLPYELRLKLGADSIYTGSSIPGFTHIAFADKSLIKSPEGDSKEERAGKVLITIEGKLEKLRKNFLLYENELLYNSSDKYKWLERRSIYTKWLEAVVDEIWENENWVANVNRLDSEYGELQKMLEGLPEEDRLNPEQYDAACWQLIERPKKHFVKAAEKVQEEAKDEEIEVCNLTALKGGIVNTLDDENMEKSLQEVTKDTKAPISKKYIVRVASFIKKDTKENVLKHLRKQLYMFIKEDLNSPDLDVVKTLEKYKEAVDGGTFAYLLARVFFGAGGGDNAKELRNKWYKAKLEKKLSLKDAWKCLSVIDTELQKLLKPFSESKDYESEFQCCFERTKKEMSEVWADMFHEQISRGTELILLKDVLEFVRNAAEYQNDVMWEAVKRAAIDMTANCKIGSSSAGIEEFKDIQSAFYKVKNDDDFEKLRFDLIMKEYEWIKEHGGLKEKAVPNEKLTEQLRAIEADLPKGHEDELKEYVDEMFLEAYDMLFDDPKPFMDSEWLIKEAESRPCLKGSEKLLYVLSEIAKDPKAQIFNLEKNAKLNLGESKKCGKVLIKMYLGGLVPELGDVTLEILMNDYPESRDELLKYLTEKGGGERLLKVLKWNRDFRADREYKNSNNFIATLQDVSENSEMLSIAEKSDKNESFDEKLIDFIIDSYNKKFIGERTAKRRAGKVYEHYERYHNKKNRTLKCKAETLDSAPGFRGIVGGILKKK